MNGRKDNSAYGSYVPYSDQDINVPVTAGQGAMVSPYLNFNPAYIQNPDSQYIYPEGATGHRGMWEKSFSIIGYSVFAGGSIGALNGLYKYRRELALREAEGGPARPKFNEYFKGPSYKILRKQALTAISKQSASGGQSFGIMALWYTLAHLVVNKSIGSDDKWHCVPAGIMAGMLYQLPDQILQKEGATGTTINRQIPFMKKTISYTKIPPIVKGMGIGLIPALIVGFASTIGLGDLVS
ncbi:mitochondrial import inner membrane translocase subunit Tim23-like [Crassostrea virginica]|uniref:Uncharacterized protein LOC111122396 n=1 Tax=Crassostrea virginica TaxID=6565 RepID=A0A8B8CVQ4_CRAVI|nr:uncharacterized protein LOC111122396 [Crassostrea virginica]